MSKTDITKIEKEKWYNLLEIVKLGLFTWCKDVKTIRNWVLRDKLGKDKLKAMIVGNGRQARYKIKGKNIVEFIKSIEDGNYLN